MSKKKQKGFSGKITMIRARKIFQALGFKTADKWDAARLTKKIGNLSNLAEGAKLDSKNQKKVDMILRALKEGRKVIVVDVDDMVADAKRGREVKQAQKRGKERVAEEKDKAKRREEVATKKTAKKAESKKQGKKAVAVLDKKKKPGVIMSVLEFIKADSPISGKKILSLLKKRFPDKNPESMERSIPQIPGYLRKHKNIDVIGKNDKGQYIIKEK